MYIGAKVSKNGRKFNSFLQSQKGKRKNVEQTDHRNFRQFGAVLK
jgi:hypothetical protein